MTRPTYVLGTGLSHDGSAVLLRDGKVAFGIAKERLTRRKHDGGNDSAAIAYCLDAEGIGIADVALVVQCGLFDELDRFDFEGPRPWKDHPEIPVITISHHLAHAYSAVGTAPFDDFDIVVVDGCGSPRSHCSRDRAHLELVSEPPALEAEKDSYYRWRNGRLEALLKDFSPEADHYLHDIRLPSTRHSIGGFYAAISGYCLGSMDDVGKLMGLAPYGELPALDVPAFDWVDDRLIVTDLWQVQLREPMVDAADFALRFDYFASVARWAQNEVEQAMQGLVARRQARFGRRPLALSGGVALNAVANASLLTGGFVDELYIEPAAGDDGLALGCAFFGWISELGRSRATPNRSTCFGKATDPNDVELALRTLASDDDLTMVRFESDGELARSVAELIGDGAVIGWFQGGSEFGPRALGRRSILAHPGIAGLRDHINRSIKFREDFRPFAPSILPDEVDRILVHGHDSPHMILVDEVHREFLDAMCNVAHCDRSTRCQIVDRAWNPRFHELLEAVRVATGIGVVLNTSFNKRGQPIVETPDQAVALFRESALDVLVIERTLVTKRRRGFVPARGDR